MSQQDILKLFKRTNRPMTRSEVYKNIGLSIQSTNRSMDKLLKCNLISKEKLKGRKQIYFLK